MSIPTPARLRWCCSDFQCSTLLAYGYAGLLLRRLPLQTNFVFADEVRLFVNALGFGGLACFVLAYLCLAARVGWAFVYAATRT